MEIVVIFLINQKIKMNNVTALTVFYKTPTLIHVSLDSFRRYYPEMQLVVVNNSPKDDVCTRHLIDFLKDDENCTFIQLGMNYGHGPGLNRGMKHIKTSYVYIFDSDVEIIREGFIEEMMEFMDEETYGVGFTRLTTRGGQNKDKGDLKDSDTLKYLHPLACLISVKQYYKFPKFYSGGAPFNRTMGAIKDTGEYDKLIKHFPVIALGHTGSMKPNYIKHHGGSTRARYGISSPHIGE